MELFTVNTFSAGDTSEGKLRPEILQKRRQDLVALLTTDPSYQAVLDLLPNGIIIHTSDGTIISCNSNAERLLGLSISQMQGLAPLEPDWQALYEDGSFVPTETPVALLLLPNEQAVANSTIGIHQPDGRLSWLLIRTQVVAGLEESDQAAGTLISSLMDITPAKQTTEALRQDKEHFSALLQASPTAKMIIRLEDGVCVEINSKFTQISGYFYQEIVGHTTQDLPFFEASDSQEWFNRLRQDEALPRNRANHSI